MEGNVERMWKMCIMWRMKEEGKERREREVGKREVGGMEEGEI